MNLAYYSNQEKYCYHYQSLLHDGISTANSIQNEIPTVRAVFIHVPGKCHPNSICFESPNYSTCVSAEDHFSFIRFGTVTRMCQNKYNHNYTSIPVYYQTCAIDGEICFLPQKDNYCGMLNSIEFSLRTHLKIINVSSWNVQYVFRWGFVGVF